MSKKKSARKPTSKAAADQVPALPALVEQIKADYLAICEDDRSASEADRVRLKHALMFGQHLREAQKVVYANGDDWLPWAKRTFAFKPRKAQRYIRLIDIWDKLEDATRVSCHSMAQVLKKGAEPKETTRDEKYYRQKVKYLAETYFRTKKADAIRQAVEYIYEHVHPAKSHDGTHAEAAAPVSH